VSFFFLSAKLQFLSFPLLRTGFTGLTSHDLLIRFHNGQTINLAVLLGLATMFYTWRPAETPALRKEFMRVTAFTGSIYWLAGIGAIVYPGTMGLDPEFGGPGFPQAPLFTFAAFAGLLGSWLSLPGKGGKGN
jgi:hypothetical protein